MSDWMNEDHLLLRPINHVEKIDLGFLDISAISEQEEPI